MPTALETAYNKVARAMTQREAIEKCIAGYRARNPYEILTDPNGKQEIRITEQPPDDISLLLGESLYQLRSALDHVFYDLISKNPVNSKGSRLDPKWERDAQFPLNTSAPDGFVAGSGPVPKEKFNAKLRHWIPDPAYAFIERVQPYYRGNTYGNELLRLLTKLSNIDKHRRLNTTVARLSRHHVVHTRDGGSSTSMAIDLDTGTQLYEPYHHHETLKDAVKVEDNFTVEIAFDEPEIGPPRVAPIEHVIYDLPTCFLGFWLPNLSQFL